MSDLSLSIYAQRARSIEDPTLASGRTLAVRGTERVIRRDVMGKLGIAPNDRVLDIGSGIGTLAIPLSYFVESVTCVDHPEVLERLAKTPRPNIELVPGNFFNVDLGTRRFTKAIAYAVVHYLSDMDHLFALIDKTLAHLEPGGLFLIGDVPNEAYKDRIWVTAGGQRIQMDWAKLMMATEAERKATEDGLHLPVDTELIKLSDLEIMGILLHVRRAGHHAYVVRQSPGLPWAHQREDILIEKLEPAPHRDMFVAHLNTGRIIGFAIRQVLPEDCDGLYGWSQDPSVRAASIRTEAFTIEQHREWYARKLEKAKAGTLRWYILEEEITRPMGQVRYEKVVKGEPLWTGGPLAQEDGDAEISISVVQGARGAGIGRALLERTEAMAKKDLGVERLVALIRPENASSISAFERVGYVYVRDEERMGVTLRRYEK
ncbi:MAG: GNAT family N-acetyltransferase [Gemmatimonadaceae bacterium]|nr:GNAT family N-acetyltransferase [Gemmatimonadaceae bacterium]